MSSWTETRRDMVTATELWDIVVNRKYLNNSNSIEGRIYRENKKDINIFSTERLKKEEGKFTCSVCFDKKFTSMIKSSPCKGGIHIDKICLDCGTKCKRCPICNLDWK